MPGISIASAGVTFQMFNAAFLAGPVGSDTELARRITQAAVHFRARGLEWAFWLCEGWVDGRVRRRAKQLFRQHNLKLSVELPGMLAEHVLPPVMPLPPLDIRRVADQATRGAFCAIGAVCFNVPLRWFHEVFDHDSVWHRFVGYVGYAGGEPVSTAATVASLDVIGVYNVATLPGQQGRGYGEAIMRHALERARLEHGLERTALQSTPQGYRIYERMGYRTVTRVTVYAS